MVTPGKLVTIAPDSAVVACAVSRLEALMPGRTATHPDIRRQHASTLTGIESQPPSVVAWPQTTAEVAAIVALASDLHVPIIAFGAGTSLEGHVNAPLGGIAVDMTRMNRIVAVNAGDQDARVEAGVTLRHLNEALRDEGLFFSVDPGALEATLGGMAATRASGTNTVRYGSMRDNVLSLTAVMAGGEIVTTGTRARKSAAGYDLTRLLIGSEGTLGIITELIVRLHARPEAVVAVVAYFPNVRAACDAAISALQSGVHPARIELLDAAMIAAVNRSSKLGLREAPALFVECHGTKDAASDAAHMFEDIAAGYHALATSLAATEDGRRDLWQARRDCFWSVKNGAPGKSVIVTDVCVPLSRLADCVEETAADLAACGLEAPLLGHVGDGNFHAIVVTDPDDVGQRKTTTAFIDRLTDRALRMAGTCTGEHGIGQGKKRYLQRELPSAISVMRQVKAALDPDGIFNPGKIF